MPDYAAGIDPRLRHRAHRTCVAVLVTTMNETLWSSPLKAPGVLRRPGNIVNSDHCIVYCAEQALGIDFSVELHFGRCHEVPSSIKAMQHDSNGHDLQQDCNGHFHANVADQQLNGVRRSGEVRAQDLLRARRGTVCHDAWTAWTYPSGAPSFCLAANASVDIRGWTFGFVLYLQYPCGCTAQVLHS